MADFGYESTSLSCGAGYMIFQEAHQSSIMTQHSVEFPVLFWRNGRASVGAA